MTTIYVLNGPSLNLLGAREANGAGHATLTDIEQRLRDRAEAAKADIVFLQTNHEGDLVDWIHEAAAAGAPVILNAGAYAHTSIALHDAIRGAKADVVEVNLSNPHSRESFRHHSYVASVAKGVIMGFGARSYDLALDALLSDTKQSD